MTDVNDNMTIVNTHGFELSHAIDKMTIMMKALLAGTEKRETPDAKERRDQITCNWLQWC